MDKSLRPVARPRSQTGEMTKYNRPVWKDEQSGEVYSEKTITVPYGDGFVVMPSVGRDGSQYTEKQIYEYVKRNGPIDFVTGEKLPIFESPDQADTYARGRSEKMFTDEEPMPEFKSRRPEMEQEDTGTSMMDVGKAVAKLGLAGAQLAGKKMGMDINPTADNPMGFAEGGNVPMNKQMEMFEDGGLMDEGGMVDEVSGNDVPTGSTRKEVRDDIPAMLSEGEFVFPADVVRYYGLEKLMELRQNAKMGLKQMEAMGQMGNSEEATMPDDIPFGMEDIIIVAEPQDFAEGGTPKPLPIANVPVRKPSNSTLSGMSGGMTMVTYVDENGNTMVIPHVNGVPIYPIPDGYRVLAEGESVTGSDVPKTNAGSQATTAAPTTKIRPEEEGGGMDDFDPAFSKGSYGRAFNAMTDDELEQAQKDLNIAKGVNVASGLTGINPFAMLTGLVLRGQQKALDKAKAMPIEGRLENRYNGTFVEYSKTGVPVFAPTEDTTRPKMNPFYSNQPVKGVPTPPVQQTVLDDVPPVQNTQVAPIDATNLPTATPTVPTTPTAPTGLSSNKDAFVSGYTSNNPAATPSTAGLTDVNAPAMNVPGFPTVSNTPALGMDEAIFGIDTPQTGGLFGGIDVSAQVAQSVANQAAAARGQLTGMDEAITGITDTAPTNTSVGPVGYANPPSTSANLTGIMGFGTDQSAPNATPGRDIAAPSIAAPSISGAMSAASLGYGTSRGGEFSGAPTDTSVSNAYSGLADSVGISAPSNAPSGNFGGGRGDISGAQSAASMGFGNDPGGEFGGGPGPSGGGSSAGTGGGGADSGQAAGGTSGGTAGGTAGDGTGSDNDGDGFGDMGGISGGWNKGGLVSKKKKPAKRKPNTSRGIAARKK